MFKGVNKNMLNKLGFGLMRLPQINPEDPTSIDQETFNELVDKYMEKGFNYFDTAYGYHNGLSEVALRKGVVERYPRESFIIADKLPIYQITKEEELEPTFQEQLDRCGVEYFDYYMLHNISQWSKIGFEDVDSFAFAKQKKEEGKIKHLGISFHDNVDLLESVLEKHPEIEFVQLQINYLDWENPNIQSRKCYEMATKYNKPVIVMEPVKGGQLATLPEKAKEELENYDSSKSIASWAIRFCASLDNVMMVLSGMNSMEQLEDNTEQFTNFEKLNDEDIEELAKVCKIINSSIQVPCTSCNYCLETCPQKIYISKFFELYNSAKLFDSPFPAEANYYSNIILKGEYKGAGECVECGVCVQRCPQHLDIPEYLKEVSSFFDPFMAMFDAMSKKE